MLRHGLLETYGAGCRCDACTRMHDYFLNLKTPAPQTTMRGNRRFVPAWAAARRVKALQVMGWSISDLCRELGYTTNSKALKFVYDGPRRMISLDKHVLIVQMYERLHTVRGPSPFASHLARRKGWAGPDEWSDIDNRAEIPS